MDQELEVTTLDEFIGRTFSTVVNKDDEEIVFTDADGHGLRLYHEQDCCEGVLVEDICGDLSDLTNSPVLVAEESSKTDENASESGTWTFYRFATVRGTVTMRWYGTSNGYYSEGVNIATF